MKHLQDKLQFRRWFNFPNAEMTNVQEKSGSFRVNLFKYKDYPLKIFALVKWLL